MSDKTNEHIASSILEEDHPLYSIISSKNVPNIKNNSESIIRIVQFIIEHEGLCYNCKSKMRKDENIAREVLEEKHELDAALLRIERLSQTHQQHISMALLKQIILYIKKKI